MKLPSPWEAQLFADSSFNENPHGQGGVCAEVKVSPFLPMPWVVPTMALPFLAQHCSSGVVPLANLSFPAYRSP